LIIYYLFILQLAHQLHHYHHYIGVHEFVRKEEPKDDNEGDKYANKVWMHGQWRRTGPFHPQQKIKCTQTKGRLVNRYQGQKERTGWLRRGGKGRGKN